MHFVNYRFSVLGYTFIDTRNLYRLRVLLLPNAKFVPIPVNKSSRSVDLLITLGLELKLRKGRKTQLK